MSTPHSNPLKKLFKQTLKTLLSAGGYRIEKSSTYPPHWADRLLRLRHLGFKPQAILDGGAHQGAWTKVAHRLFPEATFLLVEPNPEHFRSLEKNTADISRRLCTKALWNTAEQTLPLHLWDQHNNTGASLLPQKENPPLRTLPIPTTTIDALCQEESLSPELIKLDLQGAELPSLKGGLQTLKTCQVLLVEFGLTPAYENRTTPRQLLELLEPLGFQLQDIVDLSYNPHTQTLYGGDFIFCRPAKKV